MVRNMARDLAPTLVRDQGAEERVTYLDYQLNGRSLPALDKDDWRELRGPQLEHLATSQCEYFVHKSMRETLDYEAHGAGYGCSRQFLCRKAKSPPHAVGFLPGVPRILVRPKNSGGL